MKRLISLCALLFVGAGSSLAEAQPPLLLQKPSLSQTEIAFAYGSDIWVVSRAGGEARRLLNDNGNRGGPIFSPDGTKIAFTGEQDGNTDVYVVDATGGEPIRLTYHPGTDIALGWTPDGKRVIFRSDRAAPRYLPQLYTVSLTGGMPEELPLPSGAQASYSPDGAHLAYVPFIQWEPDWKMYRGGQTTPIWIADLSDSSVVPVPRANSNDRNPMWVGDTVYFLSDREGRFTLFAYETKTGTVRQVVANDGFDIQSASAGPGGIVYAQFGSLHVYDFSSGRARTVPVRIAADLPRRRAHFEKVKPEQILNAAISPTGKRALFEAHGEILSVPAEKGDVRNLTNSPGVANRDPCWSPDGKLIAYFSDESGEYALHLRAPDGLSEQKKISLGQPPSYFYSPQWSPDSTKIAYTDKRLNVWYVPLKTGVPVKVDTDLYDTPVGNLDPAWSPDSQWIVYTKQLPNHLHAVFVYSLIDQSIHQITDGYSDARSGQFDRNGKYLYFIASTDVALSAGWLDMSSFAHPVTASVYAAVLRKDQPSPVAPESDEEGHGGDTEKADDGDKTTATDQTSPIAQADDKSGDRKDDQPPEKATGKKENKPAEPVRIDFEGLDQRIVALPLASANYVDLRPGKPGVLYTLAAPKVKKNGLDDERVRTVSRFELKTRKTIKIVKGIDFFALSTDGEKMLFAKDKKWFLTGAENEAKPGEGALATDKLEVYVDPAAEWTQMYHEVWRIERDFFYDPHFHGLDLAGAERLYEPYLAGIASRADLNALFREMTGWLVVGHMFAYGGAEPADEHISVGLLGADYAVEQGHYRIVRIYQGENWNPDLQAPLTRPGVHVNQGDYLLAVNGSELKGTDEVYRLFQETAGKQTVIRVGAKPDGSDAHDETVVPLASETMLRYRAWIEANRQKVDQLSGGRLAYVYLPDTTTAGFANFNRYFFAQVDKKGVVIDERFNNGGALADYIIDLLNRPVMMIEETREGSDYVEPAESISGPKVMVINEMSGSGGDALPWFFREQKLGPLVGTRTWGGLIGIDGYPQLIDGGGITAPRRALYSTRGEWEVENRGVPPDIEVIQDPKLVRQGHDPQLEKAVAVALELLAKNPPPTYPRPPYPNYHQKLPAGPP